ncbi:hypothetical protein EV2_027559 [Malus domestica]|uniref:RPW8 domain-containing protein n=1 Tax=Malus domestica TaxID=3750 RepID=A0A498KDV3_MALDO|nr:hypothetical protein DVH24_018401 [Malus domestica]
MAGVDLIVGGIVGTLCSELYNLVVTLIKKTNEFSPLLEAIKSTVGGLESLIPRIEDLNEKLKISNKEIDMLKKTLSEGVKLVGKCSNKPKWYEKAKYTDKLTALDEALKRELNMLKAHAARDAKENLLLARKNQGQLVELATDWSKWLGMARKHGDQLGESVKDGRETFGAVEEIKKLIVKLLEFWVSCLIIIIVVWVILLIFRHLGKSMRIATAVPDWKILSRSSCKGCKSVVWWARVGVFFVGSFGNLFGYVSVVLGIFFSIAADITLEIRAQHQQGFSGSRVRRLLSSIGSSAFVLFVLIFGFFWV